MDPIAESNLQALPVEVLDMILLKVVSIPQLKKRAEFNYIICPKRFDQEIKSLRTVWSEWNYRFTTRWFWIKLKRLSRLTFTRLQKRINIRHNVVGIVKLKDRICLLSCSPSAIRVYKDNGSFALKREIFLNDYLCYITTIEPSVKSNSVYVQYGAKTSYTIQKVNFDEDDAVTIWLEDIQSRPPPEIAVTRNDNVFVLTNDRVCLYSAKAELLSCVEKKGHGVLFPWKILVLPQGNFVIGCRCVCNQGFCGIMSEIVCEGQMISGFVSRQNNGKPIDLWDDLLRYDSLIAIPSTPEFKLISLDIKNHLMFMINRDANSLLTVDTTSLRLVQSISLRNECSRAEVTVISTEQPCAPPALFEGLCFDTEKRALYVCKPCGGTIDVYKVY